VVKPVRNQKTEVLVKQTLSFVFERQSTTTYKKMNKLFLFVTENGIFLSSIAIAAKFKVVKILYRTTVQRSSTKTEFGDFLFFDYSIKERNEKL
jgi:hypothetical protein